MALSENLRTARLNSGMTLKQVADRVGVLPGAVNKWEFGTRVPNGIDLVKLANIFETTAETLVTGKIAERI